MFDKLTALCKNIIFDFWEEKIIYKSFYWALITHPTQKLRDGREKRKFQARH